MSDLHGVPPHSDDAQASTRSSPWSHRCRLIILRCVPYAVSAVLALLMVIFLAIPAGMPPEIELNPASSLSFVNISASLVTAHWNIVLSFKNPSKLIPVKYTHMKLQLSFDSGLSLSRPSHIPTFAQGPGNVTTVRGEALSMLAIVNDLGVNGLVSALKGGLVTIDVVAKAKRRLHLGPWWVAVFDVYASCMGVTFMAPTDSEGGGDWMTLGGTLGCTLDIFTILW